MDAERADLLPARRLQDYVECDDMNAPMFVPAHTCSKAKAWAVSTQEQLCLASRTRSAARTANMAMGDGLNPGADMGSETGSDLSLSSSSNARHVQPPITVQRPGKDFYGIPNPAPGNRLLLPDLRERLIRQEETIIFALIERAQFCLNAVIYKPGAFDLPCHPPHQADSPILHSRAQSLSMLDGNNGLNEIRKGGENEDESEMGASVSFSQYMLHELEKVYARVRRYTSPDEHPFAPEQALPAPVLPVLEYPLTLVPNSVNVNVVIEGVYRHSILPSICDPGDDQNYGSSASCDATCLQALSKRIHYGKFIAEAKCQADEDTYARLARANDENAIWDLLSDSNVEHLLLKRVENKARNYGRDVTVDGPCDVYKVDPETIAKLYKDFIIPLTKDVEVKYILHRYGNYISKS